MPRHAADPPTRSRATALPPEERRAAIIAATVPLLVEHGRAVTTRQIAQAAGVAEGTIFRVFADKDSLITATVESALDPEPIAAALRGIDPALSLDERLTVAVELLQDRVRSVWRLMTAVGFGPGGNRGTFNRPHGDPRHHPDVVALGALFAPDAERLRRPPDESAFLLRGLVLAGTHPAFRLDEPIPPAEIVALFLDGLRGPADPTTCRPSA